MLKTVIFLPKLWPIFNKLKTALQDKKKYFSCISYRNVNVGTPFIFVESGSASQCNFIGSIGDSLFTEKIKHNFRYNDVKCTVLEKSHFFTKLRSPGENTGSPEI